MKSTKKLLKNRKKYKRKNKKKLTILKLHFKWVLNKKLTLRALWLISQWSN